MFCFCVCVCAPMCVCHTVSHQAGEHIFARGTSAGKRVQSNMGAKNHVVVLPDADRQGYALADNTFYSTHRSTTSIEVIVDDAVAQYTVECQPLFFKRLSCPIREN